jgi:arachidonate 5-lipoxygenase
LCTHLIFRAGPQHAAVNNGQFESYGWVPNSPALTYAPLPEEASPPRATSARQTSGASCRPVPDHGAAQLRLDAQRADDATLLHSGESPAFHPALCPEAEEIVGGFRRRLHTLSQSIQRRNTTLDIPYRFLDPVNISRSTDI